MEKLTFDAVKHKYYMVGENTKREIPSVTTIISKVLGNPFAQETIFMRQARDKGTLIHQAISDYLTTEEYPVVPTEEFFNFIKITEEKKITWTLSEYMFYCKLGKYEYAGTIDLYSAINFEVTDTKTGSTKLLKKWQIQLSMYAIGLRKLGYKVEKGSILWLHDEIAEYIPITLLSEEEIIAFLKEYYEPSEKEEVSLQCLDQNAIREFTETLTAIEVMEEKIKETKEKIKLEMEKRNITQIKLGNRTISYVAPTKRVSIDSKKLKAEFPKVWEACVKESTVASSIRIK